MENGAERLLVHALLRERVNREPLQPETPTFFKSAGSALAPLPDVVEKLPPEHGETRRDHGEKHHSHPNRDISPDFARGTIHVERDHREDHCFSALANRFDELRNDLMQVADQTVGRHLENWRIGIFVDRDNDPRILDPREVLDRTGNT